MSKINKSLLFTSLVTSDLPDFTVAPSKPIEPMKMESKPMRTDTMASSYRFSESKMSGIDYGFEIILTKEEIEEGAKHGISIERLREIRGLAGIMAKVDVERELPFWRALKDKGEI